MRDIVILGAGGLGLEIVWLIEEINERSPTWKILGFLDNNPKLVGTRIMGHPVLGTDADADRYPEAGFVLGVGDPRLRKRIVDRIGPVVTQWPTLVSPTVWLHPSNTLGKGVVVGRLADMTVDCVIEDFVMINIHAVLGHAVHVGKYSIVDPNVTINGEGRVGECCLVGANAFIRDVEVGNNVTIGAGGVVVKNIGDDCVVGGVPARIIRRGAPDHTLTKTERKTIARP